MYSQKNKGFKIYNYALLIPAKNMQGRAWEGGEKMNKFKIAIPLLFVTLICSGLFTSCSENNPITTNSQISSARYNWTVDTFAVYSYSIVPYDTNSYFYLAYPNKLNKHSNNVQTSFTLDFYGTSMDGEDENNLVIGGTVEYKNGNYFPILKKYSNGSLIEIYRGTNSTNYYNFTSINYIDNVFWCGTNKGEIISYNNGVVHYFVTDSTYTVDFISKDRNNNINAFTYKTYLDSNGSPRSNEKLYSYNSSNWQLIFYQESKDSTAIDFYPGVKNRIFTYRKDIDHMGTYDFSGNVYTKILDEQVTGVRCIRAGGKSMNDLIIYGTKANSVFDNASIFHWNGLSASAESFSNFAITDKRLTHIANTNDTYFLLFEHTWNYSCYLLRGTKLK